MSRSDTAPRTPSPCRYCGASILWAKNERSGKPMPFDEEPASGGKWQLVLRNGEAVARYVREADVPRLRVPHFETCTNYKRDKGPSKKDVERTMDFYGAAR